MPTYEYECTACGRHIEVFQRIAEDPLTTCAACGGALRKVFHPAGIVFKGSGFYATDSRSKASPAKKGSEGSKDGSSSAKESSSSSSSEGASSSSSEGASSSEGGSKPSKEKKSS